MRAPISVVIPTRNAARDLPMCLGALVEGLSAGIIREVVISDCGSTDETKLIAKEAGCIYVQAAPGRGGQIRRGIQETKGDWILVLHADTVLEQGWSACVQAHIANSQSACVFRLRFRAEGLAPRIVETWANLRTRVFNLPYGDQGLLISRSTHDQIGGYQDIPLMEDVAIAKALRGRLKILPHVALTSAERYQTDGWARRSLRNATVFVRYLLGADPRDLAKDYAKRR